MAQMFQEAIAAAAQNQEDQCEQDETPDGCGTSVDGITPLTSLRSQGQNSSVKSPYALPAGAMWGREYPFRFTDVADLNRRLRIDLLTHQKETALGVRQGSLRPVIRYMRFASRVGGSAGGAFVPVPISVVFVNQAAAGAGDLVNTDIAPIFGSVGSSFAFLEGPGRLGFGGVENGDGWYDLRIIVNSTLTPGINGNVAVRLGWELKPAGAAAP